MTIERSRRGVQGRTSPRRITSGGAVRTRTICQGAAVSRLQHVRRTTEPADSAHRRAKGSGSAAGGPTEDADRGSCAPICTPRDVYRRVLDGDVASTLLLGI